MRDKRHRLERTNAANSCENARKQCACSFGFRESKWSGRIYRCHYYPYPNTEALNHLKTANKIPSSVYRLHYVKEAINDVMSANIPLLCNRRYSILQEKITVT